MITHAAVWDVLTSSPPRFGLSLLRALVRLLQPPESPPLNATPPEPGLVAAPAAEPASYLDPSARETQEEEEDSPSPSPPMVAVPANNGSDSAESAAQRDKDAAADIAAGKAEHLSVAVAGQAAARRNSLQNSAGAAELGAADDDGPDDEEELETGSTGTGVTSVEDDRLSNQGEPGPPRGRHGRSFSYLERALLLREVQLLRFVDTEFLPGLAAIATEELVPRGEAVVEQGQPTMASLIIVAHGRLKAFRSVARGGPPEPLGEVHAGESLGNTTALLPDSLWQYSATAMEDTWTLTIQARDLSDLLRGREQLAHAILRGFFDTFNRRLRQIIESGGSIKREWILAVDVDKSPLRRPAQYDPYKGAPAATNAFAGL